MRSYGQSITIKSFFISFVVVAYFVGHSFSVLAEAQMISTLGSDVTLQAVKGSGAKKDGGKDDGDGGGSGDDGGDHSGGGDSGGGDDSSGGSDSGGSSDGGRDDSGSGGSDNGSNDDSGPGSDSGSGGDSGNDNSGGNSGSGGSDDGDSSGSDNSGSDNSGSGNGDGHSGGNHNGNSGNGNDDSNDGNNSDSGNSGSGDNGSDGDNSGSGNTNNVAKDDKDKEDNSGKGKEDDRLYYVGSVSASDGSSLLTGSSKLISESPWVEVLGTGMWFEAYGSWQEDDTFIADEISVLAGEEWAYFRGPALLLNEGEGQIEAWTRGEKVDTLRDAVKSAEEDSVRVVAYFDGTTVRGLPKALTPPAPALEKGWVEFTGKFDGDGVVWEASRSFP
jgi:hypothetical protein